ncbi:MAG: hypothetical protein A2Z25_18320 [Planctomycetes bacterium RBG_16_55_9]|nr:MAG: hypothetical protein A2Z25_18320 [Planctomycetes bacterium RBG_16_55_9]
MKVNRKSKIQSVVVRITVCLCLTSPGWSVQVDWEQARQALGGRDKFRVLVDKVLSRSNGWIMTEKHIDEIHEAGFNVIVPRQGGDDMVQVRRVAEMAARRGMFYMAWMRGTLATTTGTRVVWQDGSVQDLYSPNAEELWDWMGQLILGHARLSVENPAMVGSFLDFENYTRRKQGNCYELSYDTKILAEFAAKRGLALPELKPEQRYPWLKDNGLFDAFRDFQIDSWRRRCRRLRRQIDAVNPRFQLIVYPRGPLFFEEAIYPEWATPEAPLIVADHSTYGRRGELPHDEALEWNAKALESGLAHARSKNVPFVYIGGIDPAVKGADPEFCGKNAVMISEATDGYWIFYEGPEYTEPSHAAYFTWFSRANRAIAARQFDFWKQPRQEPDPVMAVRDRLLRQFCGDTTALFSTEAMPEGAEKTACTVRGQTLFAVLLRAGERLTGRLEVRTLGNYTDAAEYSVFGPNGRAMYTGRAEVEGPAHLDCAAGKEGIHVIVVQTGQNAARLYVDNQYICLIGSDKTGFIGAQPRLYFLCEASVDKVALTIGSPSPGETAEIIVYDGNGKQIAKGDTMSGETFDVEMDTLTTSGIGPWSLTLGRAPSGTLEDVWLKLGPGCGSFLATHPARLLVLSEKRP